ncbi:hypothetical protein [Streptomyces sp. NPDC006971]|uniref:hypothetical protein n=1 Tax=Streptomyces sp. NPDC006971 TaxID=3154784 RepID=UPI0033E6B1D2
MAVIELISPDRLDLYLTACADVVHRALIVRRKMTVKAPEQTKSTARTQGATPPLSESASVRMSSTAKTAVLERKPRNWWRIRRTSRAGPSVGFMA